VVAGRQPPRRIKARASGSALAANRTSGKYVSRSYLERQNLNMRMGMRRLTRLTNAFSKKLENHIHALALYFVLYNLVRIHMTLEVTPAMAAHVTDRR
jgi:hypothetical protein